MLIKETQKIQTKPGAYGFLAGLLVMLLGLVANASCAHAFEPRVAALSASAEAATADASDTYLRQEAMIDLMRLEYPTVEVAVNWGPCGKLNSFYYFAHRIKLCTEFEKYPDAAVFVAAHEFAHAVTHQLIYTTDENDADEIASLSMIAAGQTSALMNAALWWSSRDRLKQWPGAEHPGAGYRGWAAMCLAIGSELSGEYPYCENFYLGTRVKWHVRLHKWLGGPDE